MSKFARKSPIDVMARTEEQTQLLASYAAERTQISRLPSPAPNFRTISSSPKKKPPFVSTTKSLEVFGDPPPKPPSRFLDSTTSSNRPDGSDETQFNTPIISPVTAQVLIEQDIIQLSHISLFQRQSIRWLNLSMIFWTLAVLDSQRPRVDKAGLVNFLQVVRWRADGTISDDEFSAMYSEWICVSKQRSNGSKRNLKLTIGLFATRQIMLESETSISEPDLDLFIGMLINEINKQLIGTPIAFKSREHTPIADMKLLGSNLEICSDQWISVSEELFFCLDSPGYGFLSFDEVFFLSACLTIGLHSWSDDSELEDDLSVGMLAASTLQIFQDAGAYISISNPSTTILKENRSVRSDLSISPFSKYVITLPMFKMYLINKGINETSLLTILQHIRSCLEKLLRLSRPINPVSRLKQESVGKYNAIYLSSRPLENPDIIGSPRLWQYSVLISVGCSSLESFQQLYEQSSSQMSPIVNFLLTDAERFLFGNFRATEDNISHIQMESTTFDQSGGSSNSNNSSNNSSNNNNNHQNQLANELHETSFRLWTMFQKWGPNIHRAYGPSSSSESHRDATYQLIYNVLLAYKTFQHQLCKILIELAKTYYNSARNGLADDLNLVCANLLPNIESILIELGLDTNELLHANSFSKSESVDTFYLPAHENFDLNQTKQSKQISSLFESNLLQISSMPQSNVSNNSPEVSNNSTWASVFDFRKSTENRLDKNSSTIDSSQMKPKTIEISSPIEKDKDKENGNNRRRRNSIDKVVASALSESNDKKSKSESQNNKNKNKNKNDTNANKKIQKFVDELLITTDSSRQQEIIQQLKILRNNSSSNDMNTGKSLVEVDDRRQSYDLKGRVPTNDQGKENKKMHPPITRRATTAAIPIGDVPSNIIESSSAKRAQLSDDEVVRSRSRSRREEIGKPPIKLRSSSNDALNKQIENQASENQAKQSTKISALIPSQVVTTSTPSDTTNIQKEQRQQETAIITSIPQPKRNQQMTSRANDDVNSLHGSIHLSDLSVTSDAPSSIAELFERGQKSGSYAQSLREILRKMSKDDSHVQVKSLEQVLRLGHEIVERESREKKQVQINSRSNQRTTSPTNRRISPKRMIPTTRNDSATTSAVTTTSTRDKILDTFKSSKSSSPNRISTKSQPTTVAEVASVDKNRDETKSGVDVNVSNERVTLRTTHRRIPGMIPGKIVGRKVVNKKLAAELIIQPYFTYRRLDIQCSRCLSCRVQEAAIKFSHDVNVDYE